MSRHDDLLALVDDIYRAAGDSDHWPRLWSNLCTALGSSSAGVLSTAAPITSPAVFAGMTAPEASALYNSYYGARDPWLAESKQLDFSHGPQTMIGERLVSPRQLARTEFYADFGRRYDIARPLATVDKRSPADVFVLTVVRSERAPAWEDADATFIAAIGPHVRRAIDFHARLSEAEGRARVAEEALEALDTGVACLDGTGRAVFANAQARRIAADGDGFGFDKGYPTSSSPAGRAALQRAIAVVLGGQGTVVGAPPAPVLIPRPSGRSPYRVDVAPARQASGGTPRSRSHALLFIVDPARTPTATPGRLIAIFGLTTGEATVATLVGEGRSLEEIAELRAVRVQTVRTQLKQIFAKTGANRQSALAALVRAAASPLRDAGR